MFKTIISSNFFNAKNTVKLFVSASILLVNLIPIDSIAKPKHQIDFIQDKKAIAINNNTPNPYSIGGIRIRMTESQVRSIWGKPFNRSEIRLACLTGFSLTYLQSEVVFEKRNGNNFSVSAIKTKNRKWKTENGIKVGDNISKARKEYRIKDNNYSEWYVENPNHRPGVLIFKANSNRKITGIDLIAYGGC